MEKTAVEWFNNSIFELQLQIERKEISLGEFAVKRVEIFEKAKEMERDQLIMFGAQCMVEAEKQSGLGAIKIYELYFNKTFKSE